MSTYELDDDLVRVVVTGQGVQTQTDILLQVLRAQIPIPVPTLIGAVVETDSPLCRPDPAVFIRWASPIQTDTPWILREELDMKQYSTAEIGRITKVHSEGVDL